MSQFFQALNYSSVNEDWRTEAAALQLADGHRVLCITGSGDRSLDLLAVADVSVVSIDTCPAQNHLLRLKMAAMQALPYDDYARFLGLTEAPGRWRRSCLDGLPLGDQTRAWWSHHTRDISKGVLYRGRFERHFRRISRLARMIRPRAIRTLLAFEDLEAQRRFLADQWDTPTWRAVYGLVTHPAVSRMIYGDPAYYQHIDVDPGPYLFDRMRAGLDQYLARDSFMVHLVLTGRLSPHDLPPYLTRAGTDVIRDRLARLEVVDGEVGAWLSASPLRFDRFSLSDVPSYLDQATFDALTQIVHDAAAPGARVVIRQFLNRYPLPANLPWMREPELEQSLAIAGRDFAYDYIIARVNP